MCGTLLLISLLLLSVSKLADLWTTVRYVGKHGESNPFARGLFRRFGFAGGLAAVMLIWGLVVGAVYVSAWSAAAWIQMVTAVCGTFVAWVQWDVARFNATRKSSRITLLAARVYGAWGRRCSRFRGQR